MLPNTPPEVEPRLRAACRRTASHPSVEAVMLIGSRARGDHRPDSDWDLAVIGPGLDSGQTDRAALGPLVALQEDIPLDVVPVSLEDLRRNARYANRIAHRILCDGVLVAGALPPMPDPKKRPVMHPDTLEKKQNSVCEQIQSAWCFIATDRRKGIVERGNASAAVGSAMAAELLGKEIAAFIGLRRSAGHDVSETAERVAAAQTRTQTRHDYVALIRETDGKTSRAHLAHYIEADPEPQEAHRRRLRAVMRLQWIWLTDYAGSHPEHAASILRIGDIISDTATRITKYDDFPMLDPSDRACVEQWGGDGTALRQLAESILAGSQPGGSAASAESGGHTPLCESAAMIRAMVSAIGTLLTNGTY